MMDVLYARKNTLNPPILFVLGIVGYVLILCVATVAQADALKGIANAYAVALFLMLVVAAGFLHEESTALAGFAAALCVYHAGLVSSVIVTPTHLEVADVLKLGMTPAFFLIGGAFEANRLAWPWDRTETRLLFLALAILPLLVLAWQTATGAGGFGINQDRAGFEDGIPFGIFTNRNNAALYAVSLLALYNVLSARPLRNVALILAVCAAFGTLGVVVAAVAALTVAVGRAGAVKAVAVAGASVAVAYLYLPDAPGLNRITPVIKSAELLYDGTIDLRATTFGHLVALLKTQDLSFLFRLKHWLNLLDLYREASGYAQLFGLGIGASVAFSNLGLVPHNDYLRMLFEGGVLSFAGFVSMLGIIAWRCRRRWEAVPLFIIMFYFFSENLVNNYLAMSIFYFCAGSIVTRIQGLRHA